jgi:acyl CoA:acetate/3-ketoacid CoA transferase alpha subunit
MISKKMDLDETLFHFAKDRGTIFVGGLGQCIPLAAAHEIIRLGTADAENNAI